MRLRFITIFILLVGSMSLAEVCAAIPGQGEVWVWGNDGVPLTVMQTEMVPVPIPFRWTPKAAAPMRIHQFTPPDLSPAPPVKERTPLPEIPKRDGTPIDSGGIPSIKPALKFNHPWVFAVLLAIVLLAGILRLQSLNRGK